MSRIFNAIILCGNILVEDIVCSTSRNRKNKFTEVETIFLEHVYSSLNYCSYILFSVTSCVK